MFFNPIAKKILTSAVLVLGQYLIDKVLKNANENY